MARPLGPASAALLAWLLVGLVNAAGIMTLPEADALVRLWHHALELGHTCSLALVSYASVRAWERWGTRFGWVAPLFLASALIDALALYEDLLPRAAKLAARGGPAALWVAVMTLVFAASVPVAAMLGIAARRRRLTRAAAVSAGLLVVAVNGIVLVRLYPGVHLHVAGLAATLLGSALCGARFVDPGNRLAVPGLAVLSVWSLIIEPPMEVRVRLLSSSGSVLAPFVARVHARFVADDIAGQVTSRPAREMPPSSPPVMPPDPVVVLVGIDALRADLVANEAHAGRLPALHAMRSSAVWFRAARTPAPATLVALTSIFSGRYFSELYWTTGFRIDENAWPHADPTPRLPELLSGRGVRTAVIHGFEWLSADTGVLGRFDDDVRLPRESDERSGYFVAAPRLVDATIAYLEAHRSGPTFVVMHWLEPHAPYDLGSTDGTPFERYVAEVAIADRELARLRRALSAPHLAGRTALIVTADHGEAFTEHGSDFHGATLYDEMVRVPLLIEAPGLEPRAVDAPVTLMDLGPTIFDLFGAVTPASFSHGRSLVSLARGGPPLDRPIVLDSGRHQRAFVFDDGLKVIHDRRHGTVELFDLGSDPGERRNLVDELPHEADARLGVLRGFFSSIELKRPGYELPFRTP